MEIKYTLEKEDYLQFNLKQLSSDKRTKKSMGIQMLIPMLILVVLGIFFLATGAMTLAKGGLLLVLLIAWPFIYVNFFKKSVKKRLIRIIDQRAKELNLGPRTLRIDEKGLRDVHGSLPFSRLHHIEESKGYYFFHETQDAAYILPKRDLTQEQVDYITNLLAKINEKYGKKEAEEKKETKKEKAAKTEKVAETETVTETETVAEAETEKED